MKKIVNIFNMHHNNVIYKHLLNLLLVFKMYIAHFFKTASLLTLNNIVLIDFWQYVFTNNFHRANNSALSQFLLTTKVKTAN